MKRALIAGLLCAAIMWAPAAMAGERRNDSCEGYKGKLLNRCHIVVHPEREDEAGIGVDVLIHETKDVDLVAEYKYDFNNEGHSIYGVFKTKKSLVGYIKALFNRGE